MAHPRDGQDQLAGVFCGAHHTDGGGRFSQRVVGGLRLRQNAVGGQSVDGVEQFADLSRMRRAHQGEVHTVEGQVATEREQAHPGVTVNVLLADLDKPSAKGQQFDAGPLGGTGQRVQYNVHTVTVSVLKDLLGEVHGARIVDIVNAHAPQHFPTFASAGCRVDLGSGEPGDGDRGLSHTTGGGMDQHLIAGFDPGQVLQPVPRGGRRGRHRGRLIIAQACGQLDRHVDVTGEEGSPAAVRRHAADVIAHLVVADIGSDRGDHTGEVDAQLWLARVTGIPTHRHQHVGEVETGRGDRDLDLTGPRCGSLESGQFHGLQVAGRANLKPHTVVSVIHHRGEALLGPKRSREQLSRVPLPLAERGLVLL